MRSVKWIKDPVGEYEGWKGSDETAVALRSLALLYPAVVPFHAVYLSILYYYDCLSACSDRTQTTPPDTINQLIRSSKGSVPASFSSLSSPFLTCRISPYRTTSPPQIKESWRDCAKRLRFEDRREDRVIIQTIWKSKPTTLKDKQERERRVGEDKYGLWCYEKPPLSHWLLRYV